MLQFQHWCKNEMKDMEKKKENLQNLIWQYELNAVAAFSLTVNEEVEPRSDNMQVKQFHSVWSNL